MQGRTTIQVYVVRIKELNALINGIYVTMYARRILCWIILSAPAVYTIQGAQNTLMPGLILKNRFDPVSSIRGLLAIRNGANNCVISRFRCSVTCMQTLMYITTCLFTLTFPWRSTLPRWCWARRHTVTPTRFYSGRISATSRLRHIAFWTEKATILVVL